MNIKNYKSLLTAIVLSLILVFAVSGQESNTTQKLSAHQPIERQIKSGEKHSYQIELAAGQFLRVEVIQPNVNVEVKFFGTNDGKEINIVNNFGAFASAYLSYEAEQTDEYRLEIAAAKMIAPNGKYVKRHRQKL